MPNASTRAKPTAAVPKSGIGASIENKSNLLPAIGVNPRVI